MGDFDYVIVGSGAGGGPLAARLAQKGFAVLLLEAGGDPSTDSELGRLMYEVPIFHGLSTEYRDCRWDYFVHHFQDQAQQEKDSKLVKTDPATCAPISPGAIWYPRAGALGGCTAHNAMITVTPQDTDWNYIAAITGDSSWAAENMNRYFARLENCHYQSRPGSLGYVAGGLLWSFIGLFTGEKDWRDWAHGHGFDGWLTTTTASPLLVLKDSEIIHLLISAIKFALKKRIEHPFLGLLTRLDPNDARNDRFMREGLALTPLSVGNGRRSGPRELLLQTAKEQPKNLTIRLHSLATKVIFEGNRAVGVEFLEGQHLYQADPVQRKGESAPEGKPRQVFASREVILCAGAFNSPQLLKLSGIGPRNELEAFGIDVVADVPGVGSNLQDRYEISIITEFARPFALLKGLTFEPPKPGGPVEPAFQSWEQGKGLYCSNGSLIGIMKRSAKSLPDPDLYIFGLPGTFGGYAPGYSKLFERHTNRFTWVILKAYTNNPAGTVRLQSADPTKWPRVEFNSFSAPASATGDVDALVSGMEFVREMNRTLGASDDKEVRPGLAYNGRDKLREWIRNEAWGHHASCSNNIGPDSDPAAVLDSRFRVRGVKNLRVVDASVFPKIPGYFIVSAVYMISEKAADVIAET
jgi:choline dehydrogenase